MYLDIAVLRSATKAAVGLSVETLITYSTVIPARSCSLVCLYVTALMFVLDIPNVEAIVALKAVVNSSVVCPIVMPVIAYIKMGFFFSDMIYILHAIHIHVYIYI
jgi:hypothetical protein